MASGPWILGFCHILGLGLALSYWVFAIAKNRHEHLCMGSLGHGWGPFIVTTRLGSAGVAQGCSCFVALDFLIQFGI
jgi:hypothetical protein